MFALRSDGKTPYVRMLYLIPTASITDQFQVPFPIVIRTRDWDHDVAISSEGVFVSQYDRPAERRTHLPLKRHQALLHSNVVSLCPAPEILPSAENILVLAPFHKSELTATIYVLPLSRDSPQSVSIPVSHLEPFCRGSSILSLYCQETKAVQFLDRGNQEAAITVKLGNGGGGFVVTSGYELHSAEG